MPRRTESVFVMSSKVGVRHQDRLFSLIFQNCTRPFGPRSRTSRGLEFVKRRGQPFQPTIVSDEVEME